MNDALMLLSMPHEEALKLMVQDAMLPGLSVNSLTTANPTFGPGTRSEVGVFLKAETYNDPVWPYRGQTSFVYNRMDFADFFSGINLSFRRSGSFHLTAIVHKLNTIFNIRIEPSDFIDVPISVDRLTQTVQLRASPLSARWMGVVDIEIVDRNAPPNPVFTDEQGRNYIDRADRYYIQG